MKDSVTAGVTTGILIGIVITIVFVKQTIGFDRDQSEWKRFSTTCETINGSISIEFPFMVCRER